MGFTIVAVAVGLVLGLISGGRPRYLADKRIAGWPLLVAGLALQASVNRLPDGLGLAALIASYAALLLFGLANLLRPGRESPMEEESPTGRVAGRGQGDGGAPDDRASGEGSGRAAADEPRETEPEQSGAGKRRSGRRTPGEEPDAAREGERS